MILVVDIGNSNIVIGGVQDEEIVFEARIRTEATKTSDEYCVDLKILMDVYSVDPDAVEGAIIASVVPQVLNSIQTAIYKLTGKTSLVVGPGLKTGLNHGGAGRDRRTDRRMYLPWCKDLAGCVDRADCSAAGTSVGSAQACHWPKYH